MWSDQLIARICKDVLIGEALTSNQNARSIAVSSFGAGPRQDAMTRAGFEALLRFELGSGEAAKNRGVLQLQWDSEIISSSGTLQSRRPYTLHPTPYSEIISSSGTPHPKPYTVHPTPYIVLPMYNILNHFIQTLIPIL